MVYSSAAVSRDSPPRPSTPPGLLEVLQAQKCFEEDVRNFLTCFCLSQYLRAIYQLEESVAAASVAAEGGFPMNRGGNDRSALTLVKNAKAGKQNHAYFSLRASLCRRSKSLSSR
jgi:hypothetical protein